jgi:hypothetical protein
MFPLDYALAVTLLTAAPETGLSAEADRQLATVWPTAQAVAVSWEILDARETEEVLARAEGRADYLKDLRRRRLELADAPPLHDCQRFPDRGLINDLLAFNRSYRKQLCTRQSLEVAYFWELKQVIQETDRLYDLWDMAREARTDYYYVWVRRAALKKLRDTVGAQTYYSGCLPPHVPVWNFARLD